MQEPIDGQTLGARVALALTALVALGACAATKGTDTSAQVAPTASTEAATAQPSAKPSAGPSAGPSASDAAGTTTAAAPAVPAKPDGPKTWTEAFTQKTVIVADHVRIEGPEGLLDHVVVSSDDVFYERTVTHNGAQLTQVTMRLDDDVPIIRAQLDQWQIAAFRQVTVIERAEPCDVTVVATGDASLRDPLGKEERGETLRWVGNIPK